MDFDYRAKRLENEQKKIKEAARKKIQQEKLLQERQLERERELAEHRQKQEELREKLRLEQEAIQLHEQSLTNGIQFSKEFQQFFEVEARDVEYGDKITLSEDNLVELTNLDVFQRHQAINFQLEISYRLLSQVNPSRIRKMITYCGINEFTAPKESIGLPPKIVDTIRHHSTFSSDESAQQYFNPFIPPFLTSERDSLTESATPSTSNSGNKIMNSDIQIVSISLRYILLPKCTYIKLKPKFHDFYHIEAIKRCLEENLSFHTSISVNDLLNIKYRGEEYPLLVTDVKPERYGSLLNTDVEVDFDYSEEYEQHQQQHQEPEKMKVESQIGFLQSQSLPSNGHKLGSSESAAMEVVLSDEDKSLLDLVENHPVTDEPVISLENKNSYLQAKFKLLNGKSRVRKFLFHATLLDIFAYVISELKRENCLADQEIPSLQLSISNPTKTFFISDIPRIGSQTLSDLELNVKSQLFFVSLVN